MSDDHCSVRLSKKLRETLDEVEEERFESRSEAIRYAINVVFIDELESHLNRGDNDES